MSIDSHRGPRVSDFDFDVEPARQPIRPRRPRPRRTGVALVVAAAVVCGVFATVIVALVAFRGPSKPQKPQIVYGPSLGRTDGDDLDSFLWFYGYPDAEETTEHDNPRPPMVSRFLIYRNEKVEMAYPAEFPFGSKLPHVWTCVGALDSETQKAIDADEAFRRLKGRKNPEIKNSALP
jgi:hypothetical protein